MKRLIVFLLFAFFQVVLAQNSLDAYFAQIEQCQNLKQVDSLIHVFDKKLQKQPEKLLKFYSSVFRYAYRVKERQLKALSAQNQDELIKKDRQIEKQFNALSDTIYPKAAALCKQIPIDSLDEDLRKYCLGFKVMAEYARFRKELRSKPRPDFQFTDIAGQQHHLYDFKGHYVLLHFWNMHSTPCVEELPHLRTAYQKYAPKGLIMIHFHVTVGHPDSSWEAETFRNFIQETEMPGIHVFGAQASKIKQDYFVRNFPTNYLLNPESFVINPSIGATGRPTELQGQNLLNYLQGIFGE